MKWNTQKLKAGEQLKKNKLYELSADNRTAVFTEEHKDSKPEIVEVEFQMPQSGMAVAANEYRNKDYAFSKAADILCILIDESQKKLFTYIFDIKRTITGYDEKKTLKELRMEVVERILEFIRQIQDSMIHKDGLIALYRYDGYTETVKVGIITRAFDAEKLKRLSKRLEAELEKPSEKHGMIGRKYLTATQSLRKQADILRDFGDKKIKVLGQRYDLQVMLLEYSEAKDAYYRKIVIGG